jgi:hypothetical protein
MRSAIIALALLGFAGLAHAQTPPAASQTPAASADSVRLSHQILSESGIVQAVFATMGDELRDQARSGLLAAPWAASLSGERRARFEAYVDRLPDVMMEQFLEYMPQVEQRLAASMSELYASEHITAMADYFGSPDGAAVLKILIGAGVASMALENGNASAAAGAAGEMTPAQAASLRSFEQTPAWRAFNESTDRIGAIVTEALISVATAPFVAKVRTDICAIVETTPCPVRV